MVCYDIGAHSGFYTLLFSRLTGHSGFVYAFEPLPINLSYLKKHIELNNITNVEIIPCAVSEKSGISYLRFFNDTFTAKIDSQEGIKVKLVSIDEEINKGNILPPNIIKIDVEGHELSVLKGMFNTIKIYKPIIFIALDNPDTKMEILKTLKSLDYKLYDLKWQEIKNISHINEIVAKI